MSRPIKKFLFFLPSAFYYALIFFLSSKNYQVKVDILFFDKIIHLIEFAGLGFLLSLGFFMFNLSFRSKFFLVATSGIILAILDEIHQFFVPLRSMEAWDLAADVAGIVLGFFVFKFFYVRKKGVYFS